MKDSILSCIIGVILLLFSNITVSSATNSHISSAYDSVRVSLLTCSSHPEVYSLYGHTAIRYQNLATGQDFAINYGVFDFSDKWFIPKFTFGIADYSMGIVPFYYFESEYRRYGSSITQQEINLTAEEKEAVSEALADNYLPQNRLYSYNCFYKNCSTMARDIIVNSIDGKVVYPENNDKLSFRDMIHSCNNDYAWAKLGNDMVLGVGSDLNTTTEERHFLPENLMNSFDGAYIVDSEGNRRPLVKSKDILLREGSQKAMEGFPLSPMMCAGILFVLTIIVCISEVKRNRMSKWFDTLLMIVTGLAGIIITVMFFSQHPSTSTNMLVFMLNPMPLFFIHNVFKADKNGNRCVWWKIWTVMSLLTLLSAFVQDIDMSMIVVAVVILLRALLHLRYEKNLKIK